MPWKSNSNVVRGSLRSCIPPLLVSQRKTFSGTYGQMCLPSDPSSPQSSSLRCCAPSKPSDVPNPRSGCGAPRCRWISAICHISWEHHQVGKLDRDKRWTRPILWAHLFRWHFTLKAQSRHLVDKTFYEPSIQTPPNCFALCMLLKKSQYSSSCGVAHFCRVTY